MKPRRQPGDQIVLREVWRGKVWTGRPVTIVQDGSDLLALYMAAGARWKRPVDQDGCFLRLAPGEWALAGERWSTELLRLVTPGAAHSVILLWTEGFNELKFWYVNLEEPLRRTSLGFDYMDQVLDIVISADRSEWRWKDEDELEEALALGLITPEKARELRIEGERVIEQMQSGRPPFNGGWESWRPDPAWPIPELPAGWDVVE